MEHEKDEAKGRRQNKIEEQSAKALCAWIQLCLNAKTQQTLSLLKPAGGTDDRLTFSSLKSQCIRKPSMKTTSTFSASSEEQVHCLHCFTLCGTSNQLHFRKR